MTYAERTILQNQVAMMQALSMTMQMLSKQHTTALVVALETCRTNTLDMLKSDDKYGDWNR